MSVDTENPLVSDIEIQKIAAALRAEMNVGINDIQKQLEEKWKAGTSPADKKVQELEVRLVEKEKLLSDIMEKNKEELRLIETEMNRIKTSGEGLIQIHDLKPGDKGYTPNFKGHFIQNLEETRRFVRSLSGRWGELSAAQIRDLTSSGLSSGGQLPVDVADTFIDNVISQQATLGRIQIRRMNSNQGRIDELIVAAQKIRVLSELSDTGLLKDATTTAKRDLATTECGLGEDISLSFLEDNIERRNAEAHVATLLARQFGTDLNDLAWNGDGATAGYKLINKGFITLRSDDTLGTAYTATSATTATEILSGMHRKMPSKFLGRLDLDYFVPIALAAHYADETSTRETALGDDVLINGFPALRYFGRPVIPETHLPATTAWLTPRTNLVFGIQRNITVDSMWQPRKRGVEYTITARIDFQIATGTAIVYTTTIPSGLQS